MICQANLDKGACIVNELAEIVNHDPYCTSRDTSKFLNCSKNTVLARLNELSYKNKWSTWIFHNLSANHERERQQLVKNI